MKVRLSILFLFISVSLAGQEEESKHTTYFYINPFNAGINTIAVTWENRAGMNSFNLTGGYIYQKSENAIEGFGYDPENYIIINTLWAYNGFLLYPGFNHYLKKNPDSWLGARVLFKYMYNDSLDIPWEWKDPTSLIRRVQSDDLFVTGFELLYGIKTDFAKHFFYEIFMGAGFRVKFHNMQIFDSYIQPNHEQHPDPVYPFTEKHVLFRPTIHLGINLGLKL